MDKDILDWTPWEKDAWDDWLKKSKELVAKATQLNAECLALEKAGNTAAVEAKRRARNDFISTNSAHWGKLKPWLLALSGGKCWFTDTTNNGSHYDVEHFRPKAEARNLDGVMRDGYWWLAFDYTNYRLAGGVPNTKKSGWFPLHPTSRCSTVNARCEKSEVPYLLDPISSADHLLLAFNEEGNAIPVPSADNWVTSKSKWDKERADESIKRYKLNDHDALPSARRILWGKVTEAIEEFLEAKSTYDPVTNPTPLETMEQVARKIEDFVKPSAEFSSVAKWCIQLRNDPQLSRLA